LIQFPNWAFDSAVELDAESWPWRRLGVAQDRAWSFDLGPRQTVVLPIHPTVGGFVANTGFWSCFAALLYFAPRAFRAILQRRSRRCGRCVRCGYSLVNLPPNSPCPECGAKPEVSA